MSRTMICILFALVGWTSLQAQSPKGHLIMIGGGDRPPVIIEKWIELAGGKDARLLVIPTASELKDTGEYYEKQFREDYGCINVSWLDVWTPEDANKPGLIEQIEQADGIFFAGGDQRRITRAFLDSPLEDAIRQAYQRGAAICGTSAGTACMSERMITGDGDFEVIREGSVELWRGFGLFPRAILDQHFVERQRQNRLLTAVLENPEYLGIGIGESTAAWLKPDGVFEVIGDGWVMVFDAKGAAIRTRKGDLGVRGLTTHILLSGDRFDLETREVSGSR